MKINIKTEVVTGDGESELNIEYEENVVTCKLGGKEIFRADWEGNLLDVFKKAIEIFKETVRK